MRCRSLLLAFLAFAILSAASVHGVEFGKPHSAPAPVVVPVTPPTPVAPVSPPPPPPSLAPYTIDVNYTCNVGEDSGCLEVVISVDGVDYNPCQIDTNYAQWCVPNGVGGSCLTDAQNPTLAGVKYPFAAIGCLKHGLHCVTDAECSDSQDGSDACINHTSPSGDVWYCDVPLKRSLPLSSRPAVRRLRLRRSL